MTPYAKLASRLRAQLFAGTFLRHAYAGILGREPDPEGFAHYRAQLKAGCYTMKDVLAEILNSSEYKQYFQPQPDVEPVGLLRSEAEAVFNRFPRHQHGERGYVHDFLGVKTSVEVLDALSELDGTVEDHPIPGNFHGQTNEWVGALSAALETATQFTVVELGAGWAPWCAIGCVAAAKTGATRRHARAVEGDRGHVAMIDAHFDRNGIGRDERDVRLGIVGPDDGYAHFPQAQDARSDYGGAAVFETDAADGESLPCYSLGTLLADLDTVDLLHCDIQGAELDTLRAAMPTLARKVKWLIVGTHTLAIDRGLVGLFAGHGWTPQSLAPCTLRDGPDGPILIADGTQVWRNDAQFPRPGA